MRSSYFVIAWTILFIILGLYNLEKVSEFSYNYINEINVIEEKIKEDKWEQASYILKDTMMDLEKEKDIWYKLLNHAYFNEIFASLKILGQSISLEEKMTSFKEIEKVKMILDNLVEDECCNLNRIF